MFSWRITKYNPAYREKNNRYTKCEWTSISDIGKVFNGKELDIRDYLAVEDLYTQAVITFMDCLAITSLRVKNLEKKRNNPELDRTPNLYSQEMGRFYHSLQDNIRLNKREIQYLCRCALREQLWCKLEKENTMFVHFGYDYYMYIGSNDKCEEAIRTITNMGLFVEKFESPYSAAYM